MSYHQSWIAIKDVAPETVLEELGLVESGTIGFSIDVARPYSLGVTPDGWILVFANFIGLAHIDNVRALSRHGMVLACDFQDQVDGGSTLAMAARDGEKLWEIGAALDDVFVTGTPPPEFAPIRDHYAAKLIEDPENTWMDEVPVELAKKLCGFRHDQDDSSFRGLLPRSDSFWHHNLKLAVHPKARPSHNQDTIKSQRWLIAFIVIVMLWALSPLLPDL